MRARVRNSIVPFTVFTASWLSLGFAQTQKPPVFRATTNIIQTDVTVLDRDGRPVKGLTIDDFELYEDGEKQEILGFAEVNIPDAVDAPVWLRDSSPDVTSALNGRVLLFLLDDAQVPYLMAEGGVHPDDRIAGVRRIAEQFINRMGPNDVAAVICVYDNRCDLDFTGDRAKIYAAISNFKPKSLPGGYGAPPAKVSANMAQNIFKYLKGLNSRRRTIIYITPNEPRRPQSYAATSNPGSPTTIQMVYTFKDAMRAGITVYSVNPTSLLSLKDGPSYDPDAVESERVVQFSSAPRSLSLETGGFNISKPDQFAEGVTQIFRETGSYYLLGYEPPEKKKKTGYNMLGGLREFEVRVKREGLTVKTHRGYIKIDPPKTPKNPPAASTSALAGVLPKADLPLRMSIAPFAVPGQVEALVAVTVGITQPDVTATVRDYIDVQVRAFTQGGSQRAMVRSRVDARFAPARGRTGTTEVVSQLRLKPGLYAIRASAYSERMAESGSVYGDIDVPDFAKLPLSLSGIALLSFPKPESVIPTPLIVALPSETTTEREFPKNAIARASVRVYQGGKLAVTPVTIRTTILDERSRSMLDRIETIEAERFDASRSADWRVDIPMPQLSPGMHRLRIEAFAGSAVMHRDVHFRVR